MMNRQEKTPEESLLETESIASMDGQVEDSTRREQQTASNNQGIFYQKKKNLVFFFLLSRLYI